MRTPAGFDDKGAEKADGSKSENGLPKLQSLKSSERLEQISALRARGVGDHIDLPQLVVCGDQSAGKSSVLEGLTGLPFPRQDGVCTKFPTEFILDHSENHLNIIATILPAKSRQAPIKATLLAYDRTLISFKELPDVISEVGSLMGVRGFNGVESGPAFVEDVLRIKMSGPIGMHLSVVDLPGLIANASDDQTDDDVQTVHRIVASYASNLRTIILAVVQAGNDIANQSIIKLSRQYDKAGQRTVGIITKPDLVNKGTEDKIVRLAKNEDSTKLKLGFFILKNPSPTEMATCVTTEQRQSLEIGFFQSPPWRDLALKKDRIGIIALRPFLQDILDMHLERELPKVRDEMKKLMRQTQLEIVSMGTDRPTITAMRVFLSHLSAQFQSLIIAGLHGNYHETDVAFFGSEDDRDSSMRLRALVHQLNTAFSDEIRERGELRKVVAVYVDPDDFENKGEVDHNNQIFVSEAEMKDWVRRIYANSRGRELPGNYNHILLSELFHVQSSRWIGIAEAHILVTHGKIFDFVQAALRHVAPDDRLFQNIIETASTKLEDRRNAAMAEFKKIWDDEMQQPITYNHYYTDNVQNSRYELTRSLIKKAMKETAFEEYNGKMHISNNSVDTEKLLASLQKRVIVDMDEQACSEALAALRAYYKVARKTFVDNVCKQVIERHLLRSLQLIFSPESVATLSDEELRSIAEEAPATIERRQTLVALFESLEASLKDLRR